jgi:hypothetical protein
MAVALHSQFGAGEIRSLAGTLVEQTAEFDYDNACKTLKGIRKAMMASS